MSNEGEKSKGWFWSEWGLVARLMAAVGFAIMVGGATTSALLVVEGAEEHAQRLNRDLTEVLSYLAPLIADQALVGDYAAIEQILKKQVRRTELGKLWWSDEGGRTLSAQDIVEKVNAPSLFVSFVNIKLQPDVVDVTAGGVAYGKLHGQMWPANAYNRLWAQFVKQLQIVIATLFLMLQFIWLIFRGNLGVLRDLANSANRFTQGDRSVRIVAEGAPEVRLAADAFNNMADNTERLLDSLGASEAKSRLLANIVEQSSEAMWTTNLNGSVTTWNAGAATMFGYQAEEAIGAVHQIGDPAGEAERMERLIKLERFVYETRATTKTGGIIDVQVALAPLVENGQCVGKIAVARDVTERNRSEEALRTARAAAESANVAKSAFLARMSHEIRTPMNGVLGMTELLLETELTSIQRKYAETVHRSGSNLLGIINDVLDFSKIEAGKLEIEQVEVDLRKAVEDVVDMLAERAHAKGLDLGCNVSRHIPHNLLGDPLRLGQVLTNLTGNAIKFTERGSILLSLSRVTESSENVTLRFDVKDTGLGISKEAQGRIFEEFSQADGSTTRQHGGSGLGLAISKQLVEMMGGTLQVESKLGEGSNFWFTVVLKKHSQPVAKKGGVETPLGILTGVRGLLIESSAFNRGILSSQVEEWGMVNRIAESPEQGMTMITESFARGAPFDLVVMDLGYGGDPISVAKNIRQHKDWGKLRLVMLAPVGNHAIVQEARLAGFDACLIKPVRQSSLYDALVGVMRGEIQITDARIEHRSSSEGSASARTPGALLLVEDNLVNQAVATGILKDLLGYDDITLANTGREAVEAYQKKRFDLILMDCHMPDMDGFQATREIRRIEQSSGKTKTPIIALTANALAQDREDCISAGMNDHLGKPFSRKQIRDVLEKWMPKVVRVNTLVTAVLKHEENINDEDLLDPRALSQFKNQQHTQIAGLLERVLKIYLAEAPKEMEKLKLAVRSGDVEQYTRSAHTIKSSSANVGATRLSQLAAEMEKAGRSGKVDTVPELCDKLLAMQERVMLALQRELAAVSQ